MYSELQLLKKYTLFDCFTSLPTAIFILINQFLATRTMDSTGIRILASKFNPDKHPHATLKAVWEHYRESNFETESIKYQTQTSRKGNYANVWVSKG